MDMYYFGKYICKAILLITVTCVSTYAIEIHERTYEYEYQEPWGGKKTTTVSYNYYHDAAGREIKHGKRVETAVSLNKIYKKIEGKIIEETKNLYKFECEYRDGLKHGEETQVYFKPLYHNVVTPEGYMPQFPDGITKSKCHYYEGARNGKSSQWLKSSAISLKLSAIFCDQICVANYEKDRLTEYAVSWHTKDGAKILEGRWDASSDTCHWKRWSTKGKLIFGDRNMPTSLKLQRDKYEGPHGSIEECHYYIDPEGHKVLHGKLTTSYNGKVVGERNYMHGVLHGKYTEQSVPIFYLGGGKEFAMLFGQPHGPFVKWYTKDDYVDPNDMPDKPVMRLQGGYQCGLRNGLWIKYDNRGDKSIQCTYKHDDIIGEKMFWAKDYLVRKEIYSRDGYIEEEIGWWYRRGKKHYHGYYVDGVKHGAWIYWGKEGDYIAKGEWNFGKPWNGTLVSVAYVSGWSIRGLKYVNGVKMDSASVPNAVEFLYPMKDTMVYTLLSRERRKIKYRDRSW
jgi:antitoxin component YwqK of YwqJK toxin-antitoxin module